MQRRIRRIYFWSLFTVSIGILILIFLYINGYRWNFFSNDIVTTGSIYIDTEPENAEITLDGDLYKKTTPVLINNIYPKKYNIKLELAKTYSWQKTVDVESQKTTIISEVILFKKNTKPKPIEELPDLSLSTKGVPTFLKEEFSDFTFPEYQTKDRILFYNDHEIWMWDMEDDSKNLIVRQGTEINEVIWHASGSYIIYSEPEKLSIIETDGRDYRNVYELLDYSVEDVQIDKNGENIYFKSKDQYFKLNIL